MEIRCESRKIAEISDGATGELRILCRDRFCKLHGNEVVEHVFNLEKVDFDPIKNVQVVKPIKTNRYKRPEVKGIHK